MNLCWFSSTRLKRCCKEINGLDKLLLSHFAGLSRLIIILFSCRHRICVCDLFALCFHHLFKLILKIFLFVFLRNSLVGYDLAFWVRKRVFSMTPLNHSNFPFNRLSLSLQINNLYEEKNCEKYLFKCFLDICDHT